MSRATLGVTMNHSRIIACSCLLGLCFFAPSAYAQENATSSATSTQAVVPTDTADSSNPLADDSLVGAPADSFDGQIGIYESARVLDVRMELVGGDTQGAQKEIYVVEFRSGPLKGKTQTISSDVTSNPYQIDPREGDRVVVFLQQNAEGGYDAYIEGFDRRLALTTLVVLFVLTLVALAGWQGAKVAFSIILSIFIIGWVLIPAFVAGANPVPIALVLAVILTFLSTGFALGWNRKAVITATGTLGGVLVAYAISLIFSEWSHMSGLATDDDRLFFAQNPHLNPSGLLFAGIIIAAMGVVEDVAVSIVSAIEEVHKHNPRLSFKQLFTSGMVVGRDHMSALANTLVFAYVGASLSTLLLYNQYGGSWLKFMNFDVVADEVIRSLAGTIGLVFTVPITAVLAAFVLFRISSRGKRLVHRRDQG